MKMWLLVEWQTKETRSTYDVVKLSSVISNKNEIHEGKIVFVRVKHKYSAMGARILIISDNKRKLRKQKEILEERERELKSIVSTCMQSIRRFDMQRPHSSGADLAAGLSSYGLKFCEPKKESDASSSSDSEKHINGANLSTGLSTYALKFCEQKKESDASSSSDSEKNEMHNVLMADRDLKYPGADRINQVGLRREKRNHNRRRYHERSFSSLGSAVQPRTCSTPLQPSLLPQVPAPVLRLIPSVSPQAPSPIPHRELQSVSKPSPQSAPPRPLCVDQGTQTDEPYPEQTHEEIDEMLAAIDEIVESQRTIIPRLIDTVFKKPQFKSWFERFCNTNENRCLCGVYHAENSECLVNVDQDCEREHDESEDCEKSSNYEVNSKNVENRDSEQNGDSKENNGKGETSHVEKNGDHGENYFEEEHPDNEVNGRNDEDNRESTEKIDVVVIEQDESKGMGLVNGNSSGNISDNNSHKSSDISRREDRHSNSINSGDDMVPLGKGYAEVPRRLLREMNWSAYTIAIRQLLHACFPRKTLATHSLTGRPSPAFTDKPAKKRLNQDIVNDIVKTVTQNCKNVSASMVRSVITTTCTDEAKLFRNRQKTRYKRLSERRRSKDTTCRSSSAQSSSSSHKSSKNANSNNTKENTSPSPTLYISSEQLEFSD